MLALFDPRFARVPMDVDDERRKRPRQITYLSRYGADGWSYWERQSVWKLDEAWEEMCSIIRRENGKNE